MSWRNQVGEAVVSLLDLLEKLGIGSAGGDYMDAKYNGMEGYIDPFIDRRRDKLWWG